MAGGTEKLLQRKLSELGLKLEGTRLEKMIDRLDEELEGAKTKTLCMVKLCMHDFIIK